MLGYESFFDLSHPPFERGAQAPFVLATRPLRQLLQQLRKELAEGETQICVEGVAGVGKSSTMRGLPQVLGGFARVARVFDPSCPWPEIEARIARELGLPAAPISAEALAEARAGLRLVIAIDRAEEAGSSFLASLDRLLGLADPETGQPILQLVLFADRAAAEQRPDAPLLSWFEWHSLRHAELAPLDERDVALYIEKRLRRAGYRGGRLFSEEASHTVTRLSGGRPREIHAICERVLQQAFERCSPVIDAGLVERACGDADAAPDIEFEKALEGIGQSRTAEPFQAPLDPVRLAGSEIAARAEGTRAGTSVSKTALDAQSPDEAPAPLRALHEPEPRPIARAIGAASAQARPVAPKRHGGRDTSVRRRLLSMTLVVLLTAALWSWRDAMPAPVDRLLERVEALWTWRAPALQQDWERAGNDTPAADAHFDDTAALPLVLPGSMLEGAATEDAAGEAQQAIAAGEAEPVLVFAESGEDGFAPVATHDPSAVPAAPAD